MRTTHQRPPGQSRRGRRNADGAITVLMAFLALALFGLAALVVDLGLARDTRLAAGIAADASALAASNQLYASSSTVPDLVGAALAAQSYASRNYGVPASAWATCTDPGRLAHQPTATRCVTVDSATDPTRVRVRIPTRVVRTGLGALLGVRQISVGATAEASVRTGAPTAGPLRPWGICSKRLQTVGVVTFVPMKDGSAALKDPTADCGNEGPPGGWWVAQCVGQGNGTSATRTAVLNGCSPDHHQPVPGQPAGPPPALRQHLQAACPGGASSSVCLASDNGKNFDLASPEWQTLVGRTIRMPVFCFPPQCDAGGYASTGTNASYAIHRIAKVEVCGFHIPPRPPSTGWPVSGPCASQNPRGFTPSDVTTGAGFFLVVKSVVSSAGETVHLAEPAGIHLSR